MKKKKNPDVDYLAIAAHIGELMLEKKALDVRILDVSDIASFTDYFVICSSESEPQTKAIADHIRDELRDNGFRPSHVEGYQHLKWVLMDYYNVIVHIFHVDTRSYYGIERLWADATITEVKDELDEGTVTISPATDSE